MHYTKHTLFCRPYCLAISSLSLRTSVIICTNSQAIMLTFVIGITIDCTQAHDVAEQSG